MNVWDLVLQALGWIMLVLIVIVAMLVIVGVIDSLVKRYLENKAAKMKRTTSSDRDLLEAAREHARNLYGGTTSAETNITAFVAGARFTLAFRKGHSNDNRI